jgi:hypothetical protein
MDRAELTAPHELALSAMAAQRLDDPGSKLGCATRWVPDIAWLPDAGRLAVDQLAFVEPVEFGGKLGQHLVWCRRWRSASAGLKQST